MESQAPGEGLANDPQGSCGLTGAMWPRVTASPPHGPASLQREPHQAAAHEGEVRGRQLSKQQPRPAVLACPLAFLYGQCARGPGPCVCLHTHGRRPRHTPQAGISAYAAPGVRGTSTGLPHVQDKNTMGRGWHTAAQATASRLLLRSSRAESENTAAFIHLHTVRGCSYATVAAASCVNRDGGPTQAKICPI